MFDVPVFRAVARLLDLWGPIQLQGQRELKGMHRKQAIPDEFHLKGHWVAAVDDHRALW